MTDTFFKRCTNDLGFPDTTIQTRLPGISEKAFALVIVVTSTPDNSYTISVQNTIFTLFYYVCVNIHYPLSRLPPQYQWTNQPEKDNITYKID